MVHNLICPLDNLGAPTVGHYCLDECRCGCGYGFGSGGGGEEAKIVRNIVGRLLNCEQTFKTICGLGLGERVDSLAHLS